jgi:hypothetical protein
MCLNVSAGEAIHVVRSGETLSNILYDLNLKPIYGKHGTLKEALLLNPKINNRKDYKVYPGEKIKLANVNTENKISSTEQNRTEQNRTEQPFIRKPRDSLRRSSS